jgi:hypothetical protein
MAFLASAKKLTAKTLVDVLVRFARHHSSANPVIDLPSFAWWIAWHVKIWHPRDIANRHNELCRSVTVCGNASGPLSLTSRDGSTVETSVASSSLTFNRG